MTIVAFSVIIASLVALLVVGTEDMGSGHTVFASGHVTNRGINVQTDTNQDQGCEAAGGTSGITNACTATSGRRSTETSVTLRFMRCVVQGFPTLHSFSCDIPSSPQGCNNIDCQSISCTVVGPDITSNCITNNGIQLTSCGANHSLIPLTCTRTEPGTGITQSGGVKDGDGG
jgi:hypothetical protein